MHKKKFWPLVDSDEPEIFEMLAWDLPGIKKSLWPARIGAAATSDPYGCREECARFAGSTPQQGRSNQ